MPDLWMPGATRLDVGDHAATDGGPAKVIAHITWDRNATAAKPAALVPYENLASYFGTNSAGKAVAPHILWDPFTGRITQFVPANSRSKSLVDQSGGTRTNRAGAVVIQVEALFFPYCQVGGKTYARLVDTPCLGWDRLHAWVHSWGVPDTWPMGRPTDFTAHRSEATWETKAGWYGHSQVPENDHQDPGSWPGFAIQEDDMTPAQAAQLTAVAAQVKALAADVDAIRAAQAVAPWSYRNPTLDAASKAAGHRIPDMHGRIQAIEQGLTGVTEALAALTALVKTKS